MCSTINNFDFYALACGFVPSDTPITTQLVEVVEITPDASFWHTSYPLYIVASVIILISISFHYSSKKR